MCRICVLPSMKLFGSTKPEIYRKRKLYIARFFRSGPANPTP